MRGGSTGLRYIVSKRYILEPREGENVREDEPAEGDRSNRETIRFRGKTLAGGKRHQRFEEVLAAMAVYRGPSDD